MRRWFTILAGAALAAVAIACGSDDAPPTAPTPPSSQGPAPPSAPAPAPGVIITALDVNPSVFSGGQRAQGSLTLSDVAPAEGTIVTLSSTNTAVATVPPSVTVAAGASATTFPVDTRSVSTDTTVDIGGAAGGETRAKTIRLTAPTGTLSSLVPEFDVVGSAQTIQLRVMLGGPAPAGGLNVGLSASDSVLSLASTVTIPSGASSASTAVTARPTTSETSVTITGNVSGQSRSATVRTVPVFFQLSSTPGDYVGQGRSMRIEAGPTAIFNGEMWDGNNRLQVSVNHPTDFSQWWTVVMAAPPGRPLTPGVYRDARRVPPIGSGLPTLQVFGNGRSCNLSTGEFEVLEAIYASGLPGHGHSGRIQRFRATYRLACDESPSSPFSGEIRAATIQLGCQFTRNC